MLSNRSNSTENLCSLPTTAPIKLAKASKCLEKTLTVSQIITRHGSQMWGTLPYRIHLENVARVAMKFENSDRMYRLALAHDVIEDTNTVPEEIDKDIRPSAVLMSRNISQGDMTYGEYIHFICESDDELAHKGKLGDAITNWTLSTSTNNRRASRYQMSVPVLYKAVFGKDIDWDHIRNLSKLVRIR